MINTEVHDFDSLYYMVKVKKKQGSWFNIPGASPSATNVFRLCTIANTSFYGTAGDNVNPIDVNLDVSSISEGFSGLISDNPTAQITSLNFSIDNMELFYHKLSEANGDDLNVWNGAEVSFYMCNGLIPGMFWDGSQWNDETGTVYNPQIAPPDASYPNNDRAQVLFTGTLQDITFSASRTSFKAISNADFANVKFGTLSGANSDRKTRGQIIPIVFGDWSKLNDLAPLILERDSQDVPRLFLGTQPNKDVFNIRLYDKVSELDYAVENELSYNDDFNEVSFKNGESSADVERVLTDDITDWQAGGQLFSVLDARFPGDQITFDVDGELVAFHHNLTNFPGGQSYPTSVQPATRGWAGSELVPHEIDSEMFELDANIQNAEALITIQLSPSALSLVEVISNPDLSSAIGSGNFQRTIDNDDPDLEDIAGDSFFFRLGNNANPNNGPAAVLIEFVAKWKEFGFEGEILRYNIKASAGGNREVGTFDPIFEDSYFEIGGERIVLCSDPLVTPNNPNDFKKIDADLAITGDVAQIKDGLPVIFSINKGTTDSPTVPFSIQWNYVQAEIDLRVYAENGLWYWRGTGRKDIFTDELIEKPADVIENILNFDIQANLFFEDRTLNRDDWKLAGAIFGSQPNYRKVLKNICLNSGTASFNNAEGKEIVFDLEKKPSPDFEITQDMITAESGIQDFDYSFTDRKDIYNEFIIKFRYNPANQQYLNVIKLNDQGIISTDPLVFFQPDEPALIDRCIDASEYLGFTGVEKKQFVFEADFIRDQRTAEQLLQHFVRWKTATKAMISITTILTLTYELKIGDQVTIGSIGSIPTKVKEARYLVTSKQIQPNIKGTSPKIQYKLLEIP